MQWKSLTLGEPPSWSWLTPGPGKYALPVLIQGQHLGQQGKYHCLPRQAPAQQKSAHRTYQCTLYQLATYNLTGKLYFSRPLCSGPQQIAQILKNCAHTRKSLVKGERFIRMCGHLECLVSASLGSQEDNVQHETFARHKFLRCLMGTRGCRQLSWPQVLPSLQGPRVRKPPLVLNIIHKVFHRHKKCFQVIKWSPHISGAVGQFQQYCNAGPTPDKAGASSCTSSPYKNQFNTEGSTWLPYQILSW